MNSINCYKKMKSLALFLVFTLCFACTQHAHSSPEQYIEGVVISVNDGDGLRLKKDNGSIIKIRLYGTDAPESEWKAHWTKKGFSWPAQPFSKKAKNQLQQLVLNKRVKVRLTGDQTYGRLVGEVFEGDKSINQTMIEKGLSWWNERYSPTDLTLKALEENARRNKLGLWIQKNPVPPWEHRRKHKSLGRK